MKMLLKYSLPLFFVVVLTACGSQNNSAQNDGGDPSDKILKDFLKNASSMEKVTEGNPIVQFEEAAEKAADKVIKLTKGNIEKTLTTASTYKHCVIVLGDHTIVKVYDFDDCTQSGSWGVCMPKVQGYVKKGDLIYKDDYANNIIGTPDGQKRTVFLFK